jgi:hypothetical protein
MLASCKWRQFIARCFVLREPLCGCSLHAAQVNPVVLLMWCFCGSFVANFATVVNTMRNGEPLMLGCFPKTSWLCSPVSFGVQSLVSLYHPTHV